MIDEKEFLRIQGFANDLPTTESDIGNAFCKMKTDQPVVRSNKPVDYIQFEHAIAEIDKGHYERLLHYHQGTRAPHLIHWRDRFFIAGPEAYSVNPGFDPIRGRAKYSRDYYGILFIRGISDLFYDNVPDEMNVMLGHPPGDLEHADALMRAVHGKWVWEVNGTKHKTTVVYSNTFDEIVAGIHNVIDGVDGQPIDGHELEDNAPALAFDLGGGSLDLAYIKRDLTVDYTRGLPSFRVGANTAINTFKSIFDSRYRRYLTDAEDGLSRELILEAFMDDKHRIYHPDAPGGVIDCSDIYDEAVNPVIRDARQYVQQYTRGFVGLRSALIGGGASSLFLDKIKSEIFGSFAERGKVFTTAQPSRMIRANVDGAGKIVEAMKAVGRREADLWLRRQYGKPTKR